LSQTPYRVPHHLPAPDPSVGPTLLRFRHPSTASPERAPCGAGFRPPRPGSARRFLQPLGGFMADPSLRPCFMPLPSLGYLSLQSFTSQRSRTRLRVACSLAVIPAYPACADAAVSPRVSPTPSPSLGLLPVSPRGYGSPFGPPTMDGWRPGDHWTARSGPTPDHADHPLRSFVPPAKRAAESPAGFPARSSRALLGVPPLQSLLHPFLGPSS
jgi:hypothetical protein